MKLEKLFGVMAFAPFATQVNASVVLEEITPVNNVYHISTVGQLYWFADQVNNKAKTTINGELDNDIVVNSNVLLNDSTLNSGTFESWTPIGTSTYPYSGKFNGHANTISGLYYNNESISYVGLFGYVSSASIDSVNVSDSYFKAKSSVGGLCGYMTSGRMSYCASGTYSFTKQGQQGGVCGYAASNSTIVNCVNRGFTDGSSSTRRVGGICGYISGSISHCSNFGVVKANSASSVGGICGGAASTSIFTSCLNGAPISGQDYIGGICGGTSAISSCLNIGFIQYATSNSYNMGSLAPSTATISNSYFLEGTDPFNNNASMATSVSSVQLQSGEIASQLAASDKVWGQTIGSDATPVLYGPKVCSGTVFKGSADAESVYFNSPYLPSDNSILISDDSSVVGSNVLFNDGDNYTCKSFVLTDGSPFYTPFDFTAESLRYSRSVTASSLSTFVLPFAVPLDNVDGDVYEFDSFDGNCLRFNRVVEDILSANKPYIVRVSADSEGSLLADCSTVSCLAGGVCNLVNGDATHFGSYETGAYTPTSNSSYFALSGGVLKKATKTLTVRSFRTGFVFNSANVASSLGIMLDGVMSGVYLVGADADMPSCVDVYDVNGRIVRSHVASESCFEGLATGIYIVNGQKFVISVSFPKSANRSVKSMSNLNAN